VSLTVLILAKLSAATAGRISGLQLEDLADKQ